MLDNMGGRNPRNRTEQEEWVTAGVLYGFWQVQSTHNRIAEAVPSMVGSLVE